MVTGILFSPVQHPHLSQTLLNQQLIMSTKAELEAEIALLKEMLEVERVRADEWREIA